MSERDELAADIRGLGITVIDGPPVDLSEPLAQHLHNLGYRKPRTITTAEELDTLGKNAVIMQPGGTVLVHDGQLEDPWASYAEDPFGGPIWTSSAHVTLPATVLHDGSRA